jgi:putative oxidoreductase
MKAWVMRLIALFDRLPYEVPAVLGRFAIAATFWLSGRTKVDGWNFFAVNDKTLFLFQEEYKVPLLPPGLAALLAQSAEHIFPVLIILGLATRFSALALLGMTLVIQLFVYPGAYAMHATWAAILLMLVKFGPGTLSLDHLLERDGSKSKSVSL